MFSTGGRYAEGGIYETPDSQVAVYQFDDLVMTFELTLYTPYMLKSDPELRESDMIPYWPQNATRIEIYGTLGLMFVGRHGGGWEVYDRPRMTWYPWSCGGRTAGFRMHPTSKTLSIASSPAIAPCRHRARGTSQHAAQPIRQHQLSTGRGMPENRCCLRVDHRQRPSRCACSGVNTASRGSCGTRCRISRFSLRFTYFSAFRRSWPGRSPAGCPPARCDTSSR